MTLTKMQAMLGVATGLLLLGGTIGERAIVLEKRFEAFDRRMAKLESAIKALDSAQPDERYRTLIKELIAEQNPSLAPKEAKSDHQSRFGLAPAADAGASASSPAMVKPQ